MGPLRPPPSWPPPYPPPWYGAAGAPAVSIGTASNSVKIQKHVRFEFILEFLPDKRRYTVPTTTRRLFALPPLLYSRFAASRFHNPCKYLGLIDADVSSKSGCLKPLAQGRKPSFEVGMMGRSNDFHKKRNTERCGRYRSPGQHGIPR